MKTSERYICHPRIRSNISEENIRESNTNIGTEMNKRKLLVKETQNMGSLNAFL